MPAQRSERPSSSIIRAEGRIHQGPLPPPETLADYERVAPGFAERIFTLAEQEAEHRRDLLRQDAEHRRALETRQLDIGGRELLRGQLFGLLIGLAAIGGGVYTSVVGQPWAGGFIGTAGVVGLVSVFVLGRRR